LIIIVLYNFEKMTTITINQEKTNLTKTNFDNMMDLYNFMIDNQIVTEIWNISENKLNKKTKEKLEKSKKSSNLINI